MKQRWPLFPILLLGTAALGGEDIEFIAEADGTRQRYVEVLPGGYQAGELVDVLIALHGHGSDRWQFIRQDRAECRAVRDVAAKSGMVLVYPDYRAKTSWMGPKAEADLVQIIKELKGRHEVGRVFLTGASMGGASCLTFAVLHPELIDGVASMNGTANHLEYENFQEAIRASFGGTKSEVPGEYRKRSAEFFPGKFTMPAAFAVGGRDKSVPPDSVIRLAKELEAQGKPVLLLHREEGGHSTSYADAVEILEFVANWNPKAEAHLVSGQGSERATSGSGVKMVTFGEKTHVVWQDADDKGAYLNRIRTLDNRNGKWSEPFTLNRGKDNHARPVIAVDKEGYLHVVLSGHNSPVTYRCSVRPNDASEWTQAEDVGRGTYPVVTVAGDGTLLVTMRVSPRWAGVNLFAKKPGEPWKKRSRLMFRDPKYPAYAGYQTGLAWSPDRKTLHIVIDFYESYHTHKARGAHQAVCYMRSPDGGHTWEKSDGTPVEIPARPEQMDTLARHIGPGQPNLPPPDILAQGSIVVDGKGLPHILYISHQEKPGQVLVATPDGKGCWKRTEVEGVTQVWPGLRPMGCRGSFTIDANGDMHALLEMKPYGKGWKDGKPLRVMMFADSEQLAWVTSRDGGNSFSVRAALPGGKTIHQPNVERPAGFNRIPGGQYPPFVYFDGFSRYRKGKEVIQNNVYFIRSGSL